MARAKTHEQFVKELSASNPGIEVIGRYTRSAEHIGVRCRNCGHEWSPVAAELTRGRGCPLCRGHARISDTEFVNRLSASNPNIEAVGTYLNASTKVRCRCKTCGHEWDVMPFSVLRGHGCPECARREGGNRRRKTHEQFVAELLAVNPSIEVVGHYKNSSSPIDVRCKECGHEWSPTARSIVNAGQGCPICNRKRAAEKKRKSPQSFIERMHDVNPNIEVIGKYRGRKSKLAVRCRACGLDWEAAPNNLLNGSGCPRCAKTGTSFMEQFLCVFLENLVGAEGVISRDKTAIGRELDIFVPEYGYAIEIGSWFWHADRLKNDCRKEASCKSKGYELLTIYDCCPIDNPKGIPENSIVFTFSLGDEEGHITLRELAKSIATRLGLSISLKCSWEEIEEEASRRALPKTTEQFIEELLAINSRVEILGQYITSHSKIKCRCLECGNVWFSTPQQLLSGQGCPPCGTKRAIAKTAEKRRKTPDEYRAELKEANPNLQLLGEYTGSLNRIKVLCAVCGHIWTPRAESILHGCGCPKCSDNAKRKTQEEFLDELAKVNDAIEVLGAYRKNSMPIQCRCKKCGHTWTPRPSGLLSGNGCPKCAGKMKTSVCCIETGVVYPSFAEAARAVGLSSGDTISAACKGKRKTAGGYTWKFA